MLCHNQTTKTQIHFNKRASREADMCNVTFRFFGLKEVSTRSFKKSNSTRDKYIWSSLTHANTPEHWFLPNQWCNQNVLRDVPFAPCINLVFNNFFWFKSSQKNKQVYFDLRRNEINTNFHVPCLQTILAYYSQTYSSFATQQSFDIFLTSFW